MSTPAAPAPAAPTRPRASTVALNVARGGVIGAVEIVPGVSGGTMALVLGVYETLIGSAGHLVRGAVAWVRGLVRRTGSDAAREHLRQVRWSVLLPLGVGMLAAIVIVSATLAPLLESNPIQTRALFAGLIVASLVVPARMVGRWTWREATAAVLAAALAVWITSLTGSEQSEPEYWMVAGAASIAICALVLPGVSGSFLLLVLGMYAPTLAAVNDRDLAYLAAFAFGAIVGLSLFVTGLQWLLEHRHAVTLAAMTGLMVGSLRALWPWQSEDGALHAPDEAVGSAIALFAVGIAAVLTLLAVERAMHRRASAEAAAAGEPAS
ncbi:DUF368 domain-containing protein [uncultured Demequina sp.]|uniref:DUF368 domain-containing protein n=1 Tax=uncultured Demequina sp. TaxID=693499 RepID=UPI0025D33368|nr:DUF368 domain-containing protein [uncultured Demequina sp.]